MIAVSSVTASVLVWDPDSDRPADPDNELAPMDVMSRKRALAPIAALRPLSDSGTNSWLELIGAEFCFRPKMEIK